MYYYKVKLSYKGTKYFGWQAQEAIGVEGNKSTIQATIHQVLKKISKYQDCNISGASRTDAGVHAHGQSGKISIPFNIEASKLQMGLNSLLPNDIRIVECEECSKEFNPIKIAKNKEYHYYFCVSQIENPILGDFVAHVPGPLNIESMADASKLFVGEHDFFNFHNQSSGAATTVRTVASCEILIANFSSFAGDIYYLKIIGSGFLKHMVRYISGTLFEVGRNNVNSDDIFKYLLYHQDNKLSSKAKAKGLHLISN